MNSFKLLFAVFMILGKFSLVAQPQFIGNPVKVEYPENVNLFPNGPKKLNSQNGYLEIAEFNMPKIMNWYDAVLESSKIGSGWRLPTDEELDIIHSNKEKIPNLRYGYYWGSKKVLSSKYKQQEIASCLKIEVEEGKPQNTEESFATESTDDVIGSMETLSSNYVRLVRGKRSLPKDFTAKEIIGTTFKIGNLEIAQYDIPKFLNLEEARIACTALGAGWRLPSIEELGVIRANKETLFQTLNPKSEMNSRISDFMYWSNTAQGTSAYERTNYYILLITSRPEEKLREVVSFKSNTYRVRAVRTLTK